MRKCEVFVDDIPAGILIENDNGNGYSFTYHKEYVENDFPQICIAMPLRFESYHSDILFPFFFNMLSEGENRAMQASYLHIDKDDDFGILLQTAQYDTPGNVTIKQIFD